MVFSNEIAVLAEHMNADPIETMEILSSDTTLNASSAYLKPGFAFGGSCLTKDLKALEHLSDKHNLRLPLLTSLIKSNEAVIDNAFKKIKKISFKHIIFVGMLF